MYRPIVSMGSFTGPKIFWSGYSLRTEATGYGLVFFARLILAEMNKELKGLRFLNSSNLIKLRVTIVAVGELELSNECNLMQWSAEDFEAKLQVSSLLKELYSLPFQASTVLMYQNLDMMKQTYERSLKAASEYGYLKDNPE
ncbi:hypothetical protein BHE74_00024284 [Ensete ventricosum]|nr:hypothetical protein GW17_00022045 [Ensete ventricosum]RWW68208.1 hypothetical protein BHE74_00024284 [Ensete ventricosum]RZS01069.1 hypothetical protein BHM03_00030867 [Ensete ventricosum]